jgi:predicted AlkP superfamily pyrophosphatase or phosphodiesterase
VVLVAVDQMRGDLLERYDSVFTGGFRRLIDQGFRFTEAVHDHALTSTAVGHATLSTGVFPSRNGIVGNEWLERSASGWRSVYSVEDTLAHILGQPALEGRSPRNLLRDGLADWIQDADSSAIIVTGSKKDRAAITLAGRASGHVYWLPDRAGGFVTSSHYTQAYPSWIERLNRLEVSRILGDSTWGERVPVHARRLSRPDTAAYERDGIHTFFPHRFAEEGGSRPHAHLLWAIETPLPDAALAAFGREAIRSLGMGSDEVVDYLGLSFSQVDYVGHDYGPFSREQLDNLLRLDRLLGDLMAVLDDAVGAGRWVMALSADHGTLAIPEYVVEAGGEASRATRQDLIAVRDVFQQYQLGDGDPLEVADQAVAALEELPFIADAMALPELTSGPAVDSFATFLRNSYHPDRWTRGYGSQDLGVMFRFSEGFYPSTAAFGTGHGSPYYYDRHVPLVFYGAGVRAGVSIDRVRTVDVAPTLASLAGIPMPADLDGRPLLR